LRGRADCHKSSLRGRALFSYFRISRDNDADVTTPRTSAFFYARVNVMQQCALARSDHWCCCACPVSSWGTRKGA